MSDVLTLFADEPTPEAPGPLPENPREAFSVLEARLGELKSRAPLEALQAKFEAEVRSAYLPMLKGKKGKNFTLDAAREAMGQAYFDILGRYEAEAEQLHSLRASATEEVERQLDELAERIPVTSDGADFRQAEVVCNMDYGSQTNSDGYARASAEMKAIHYRHAGLEAEVRRTLQRDKFPDDPFFARSSVSYYEVWVRGSAQDVAVAKRKAGPSLVEMVQWCWKTGVNPRVFAPYLPHGFEERHGIRYS